MSDQYPTLDAIDLDARLEDKDEYKERLAKAQLQLLMIQRHLYTEEKRALIVFEGWDAAGKGGTIRRFVENLDPRGYEVHSIGAPLREEKLRHYQHRFWTRMPKPGRFGIFDRSWYGRVLVERVEGFCSKDEWKRAYEEINGFEKLFVDDGVPVLKFFLHISDEEQLRRFEERKDDPFRSWKLTEDDWRNREKRKDYAKAIEEMFEKTHTDHAPWHAMSTERKWYGRVTVLEACVERLCAFFKLKSKLPKGWRALQD